MRDFNSKICSQKELTRKLSLWRSKNRRGRVVFTNGCFDILHEGHVTYLQAARLKGDLLIVGVDTDSAVRKLKGPTRPVNSLKCRQKVLAALESTDFVTSFSGGDPRSLIKSCRPDVLVKGGDWVLEKILGYQEVTSWGGQVHTIQFVKGRSTTKIIHKILGSS